LRAASAGIAELDPEARPEALVEELDGRQGFECTWRGGPESLLLDRVLEQRWGHPLSLVIVYAAIARRAGVRLHPVGGGRFVILADPSSTPAVAFDPIGVPRRVPRTIGWVCRTCSGR
jgi:regulator of sirC expression with transglutaminase-like and TPR domain